MAHRHRHTQTIVLIDKALQISHLNVCANANVFKRLDSEVALPLRMVWMPGNAVGVSGERLLAVQSKRLHSSHDLYVTAPPMRCMHATVESPTYQLPGI